MAICVYYSLASLSGLFVIPVLAICAPVFLLCAIAAPVLGAVKLVDALLHLGIPFASYIGMTGLKVLHSSSSSALSWVWFCI